MGIDGEKYNIVVFDDDKNYLNLLLLQVKSRLSNCDIKCFTELNDKFFSTAKKFDLAVIDLKLNLPKLFIDNFERGGGSCEIIPKPVFLFMSKGNEPDLDLLSNLNIVYDYYDKNNSINCFVWKVRVLLRASCLSRMLVDVDEVRSRWSEQLKIDRKMLEAFQ